MRPIALVAEALDAARGGGAEAAARAVARALVRAGADVTLVAPSDRLGPPEATVRTVGVALRSPRGPQRARGGGERLADEARRLAPDAVVVSLGKVTGADVLWPHSGAHTAARNASVAAGRSALGALLARTGRLLRPVERVYDDIESANARAAEMSDLRLVALSERVRRDLVQAHGLDAARIAVVRNGVEVERFRSAPPADDPGRGGCTALFAAHAFALKGLDRAIAGLVHAPNARLIVAGRGHSAPYARLARRLGIEARVRFVGPQPDIVALLRQSDALVHPSRYDPCSLVVLEALAGGVPVIASPADGSAELVEARAGFVLADADDPREIGACLEALCDAALRRRLSTGARACARSVDDVARDLLAVIAGVAPAACTFG